jgi:formate dehydrogenase subunit delta
MSHDGRSGVDRLVMMANQIGTFFASQRHADPAIGIADHICKFWDPRMRKSIIAYAADGGEGLSTAVLRAVRTLGQ